MQKGLEGQGASGSQDNFLGELHPFQPIWLWPVIHMYPET